MITLEGIKEQGNEIWELAERHDDETAHSKEDALYKAVLETIAHGAANPSQLAMAALGTKEIEFSRWCA